MHLPVEYGNGWCFCRLLRTKLVLLQECDNFQRQKTDTVSRLAPALHIGTLHCAQRDSACAFALISMKAEERD